MLRPWVLFISSFVSFVTVLRAFQVGQPTSTAATEYLSLPLLHSQNGLTYLDPRVSIPLFLKHHSRSNLSFAVFYFSAPPWQLSFLTAVGPSYRYSVSTHDAHIELRISSLQLGIPRLSSSYPMLSFYVFPSLPTYYCCLKPNQLAHFSNTLDISS